MRAAVELLPDREIRLLPKFKNHCGALGQEMEWTALESSCWNFLVPYQLKGFKCMILMQFEGRLTGKGCQPGKEFPFPVAHRCSQLPAQTSEVLPIEAIGLN